jgi:asparagine synthase (glutamine-hydrolysing)
VCGIAGFTHINHRVDPARIRRAAESLIHRGPDQQGVFESDIASLAAVRLKIIDLEHGSQPMQSADGKTVVVFNGEVYNHKELRRELEALGCRFQSRSDTEVVLHAFLKWDLRCFEKLRGMFAVGIWMERERRLVLARDRMGIKPLYICRRGDDLYFGSEVKAILVHPAIERRMNAQGLHHFLSLNYVPGPFTLIEGIEKLPPGHWLEWRNGSVRSNAYWTLNFAPSPSYSLAEAKEELDGLLRQSVREHLIADVPLGVWASGGLDSSTVLHYAAECSARPLKTFSVSFQGRSFDESPYFRRLAACYGTEHYELDLSPDLPIADAIEQMAYYSDEPSADAGALPVWFLSKMTREHATVALSGEGADEIFGGYVTYLADRYAEWFRRIPRVARRLAARVSRALPVSDEKVGLDYKIVRFLHGSLLSPVEAHVFWNGAFSEAEKARLHLNNGYESTGRLLERFLAQKSAGSLNRFLWLDQTYYLPDDILYKCDRMSMAHSLEVRPPFLDHRIVEFAARLPENFKVRGKTRKFVLGELMRDALPAPLLGRRKEGFDIPAHQWLRTILKPLIMDVLSRRNVEESGLFRWREIDRLVRDHMERRANLGYHLWGLLVLFLWMRRWNVQTPGSGLESREGFSAVSVTN